MADFEPVGEKCLRARALSSPVTLTVFLATHTESPAPLDDRRSSSYSSLTSSLASKSYGTSSSLSSGAQYCRDMLAVIEGLGPVTNDHKAQLVLHTPDLDSPRVARRLAFLDNRIRHLTANPESFGGRSGQRENELVRSRSHGSLTLRDCDLFTTDSRANFDWKPDLVSDLEKYRSSQLQLNFISLIDPMNTPPVNAPGPMFGLAIPGRPVITDFVQETETSWHVDVPNPSSISSFSVFLLRPVPSDTVGLGVYYTATTDGATFVGALSNAKPTDIFSPGWPLNPDIAIMPAVRIGLAFEPSEAVSESVDFKREFARKVALNLFRYIESFNTSGGGDARFMRCPQDLLDRWLQRFDDKYDKDPMFVFKTT
ncbi:hypothetical protein FOZ61_006592 [Perkinsus olseni]|uniref:Hikeshi-like N-terminal domain-containing protein n=1 Tax=Perkinsus olseni TaxID=32597 RepID=A0A7J6M9T2_PEROL|nr:hypothetical protein FOZ61_006592 [Perkinsus olseni]